MADLTGWPERARTVPESVTLSPVGAVWAIDFEFPALAIRAITSASRPKGRGEEHLVEISMGTGELDESS